MVYVMRQIQKQDKSLIQRLKKFSLCLTPLLLTGCASLQTESDLASNQVEGQEISQKDETIEILTTNDSMTSANVLRDQLVRNGFDVEFNIQPDFSSLLAQHDVGNFDITMMGWSTVTGSPDYAVRSIYHSQGDSSLIDDPYVDELIDQAATELPEDYQATYTELEDYVVEDQAYAVGTDTRYEPLAFNHEVLDPDSIVNYSAREIPWNELSYLDEGQNDTRPLVTSQQYVEMTSFDPIRANDASVAAVNSNMYSRLVNLDENDEVTTDDSLSYNYVIGEGNQDYYFILRDNVNFAKVEDGQVEDTGDLVGGEDVVYSLNRAANPDSVPDHLSYSLFTTVEGAELVTDLDELASNQSSQSDASLLEELESGLDQPIQALVESDDEVDNQSGYYQVVKLTTEFPFPQVLNHLAHVASGIVSKDQVESVNDFEVEDYNPAEDRAYGDQAALMRGGSYDNHLYASGPYIMIYRDNTQAIFQKNPAYKPDSDEEAQIDQVTLRLISDATSSLSALRSGELDLLQGSEEILPVKYEVIEEENHLSLDTVVGTGVSYIQFNLLSDDRPISQSANLRRAVLYTINQDEMIAIEQGNSLPARSTLTPIIDTGKQGIEADSEKVEFYYNEYLNE